MKLKAIRLNLMATLFVLGPIVLDQLTKRNALNPLINQDLGFFGLVKNPIAIPLEMAVGQMIFFLLIFCGHKLLNQENFKSFGIAILLFAGGIAGNIIDRFANKGVIDFIQLPFGLFSNIVFNFADVFQFLALMMMLLHVVLKMKALYQAVCNRKKIWIIPKFQRSLLMFMLILSWGQGSCLITFVVAYIYHTTQSSFLSRELFWILFFIHTLTTIFALPLIIGVTARVAGPVLGLKRILYESNTL